MKLLFWRRNYRDADPIRFYCDTFSPDNTLRCTDELGHLGWCVNGDTSWRDEVWNVDHWANTEEAPPVDPEPTMSATEWVRLESELNPEPAPQVAPDDRDPVLIAMDKHRSMHAQQVEDARQNKLRKEVESSLRLESTSKPEPAPQATPNDRDPLSAAWRRGYHRDHNRAAAPTPRRAAPTTAVFACGEEDCLNPEHRFDYRPPVAAKKGVKSDRRLRAEEAATVAVLVVLVALTFIGIAATRPTAPDEPPINAAHNEVKKYKTLNECMADNPRRAVVDCNAHTTGINTARRTLFVKLTAGPNGARWLTEQYCLEENPQAKRCAKEPPRSPSDYDINRAGWVVVE